ncbi:hypothetical protein AQJ23_00495 [Streptomyces antibioticus]|nr:ribosome-inactivating family protein [Streptomyces antibioticus]KUN29305.1 hypothetical protein AQJ23_00495 [Streptomyces antibioticus]
MSTDIIARPSPFSRHRRLTSSLIVAVLGALFLTLLGPLGTATKAYAADGLPTFHVGADGQEEYMRFVQAVADEAGSGPSAVANTYDRVDHTDPNSRGFFQVDVQAWGNDNYVRLNFRRSDMYLVGWWTNGNIYNYVGNRYDAQGRPTQPTAQESSRWTAGGWRAAYGTWRLPADESYGSLQGLANLSRQDITWNRSNVNSAVWDLYNANNTQNMARGFLVMTQFVAEAARFRPIAHNIGLTMDGGGDARLPGQLVSQETDWDTLSRRFNELIDNHWPGYVDPNPIWAYRTDEYGNPVGFFLYTAIMYAHYMLYTANGGNR